MVSFRRFLKTCHNQIIKVLTSFDATQAPHKVDGMAQQLKFVACLKVLVDELATLASGCDVDGGQLRYKRFMRHFTIFGLNFY